MIGRKDCFKKFDAFDFFETLSHEEGLSSEKRDYPFFENENFDEAKNGENINFPRICLIDDDEIFCRKMAKFSGKQLMNFSWFCDFSSFERVADQHWDLILLDFYLGNGDLGIELAKYLLETRGNTPILLISASRDIDPNFQEWPSNIIGFSQKGHNLDELVEYLAAYHQNYVKRDEKQIPVPTFLDVEIAN